MTDLEELNDKIYADRTKVLKSLAKGADMAMQELEDKLSHNLRIRAALEAADKATPGPWAVRGDDCHFDTMTEVFRGNKIVAETNTEDDAILIAAAPDMAAEIVKLRKWQSEAVEHLETIQMLMNPEVLVNGQIIKLLVSEPTVVDRLIAEAKEQGK